MLSMSIQRKLGFLILLLIAPLVFFLFIGERYVSNELKKIELGKAGLYLVETVWQKSEEINGVSANKTTSPDHALSSFLEKVDPELSTKKRIEKSWGVLYDNEAKSTKRLKAAKNLILDVSRSSRLTGIVAKENPELMIIVYDRIPELSTKVETLSRLSERLITKDNIQFSDRLAFMVNAGQFKTVADYISRGSRKEHNEFSVSEQDKLIEFGKNFRKANSKFQGAALKITKMIDKAKTGSQIDPEKFLIAEKDFDQRISIYWQLIQKIFTQKINLEQSQLQKVYKITLIALGVFMIMLIGLVLFLRKSILLQAHKLEVSLNTSETRNEQLKLREKELEEAKNEAESSERAKSDFLANMSHEIRTPMNGIMGMAELMQKTELNKKQKMFANVIVSSGNSLLTIINDILDFSKIDAGQLSLSPAPFELLEAFEDTTTLLSPRAAQKDLELSLRVAPDLPKTLLGDAGRLRQIVINLLGNAVKFTESGHVYVNVGGEQVIIDGEKHIKLKVSVEDTGIGIPEDQCQKIFTTFSQVDSSATRLHEGTGLGLSIASSLVAMMDGEIGVESTLNEGSTFWFTALLPVHKDEIIKHCIPDEITNCKILIVDDNKINRSILSEQMEIWGFESAAATSGNEGLQVMRKAVENNISIDLVILDYQMPHMNGEQTLRHIMQDNTINDIPVIMLTSVDDTKTYNALSELGAKANLVKPARSADLLNSIITTVSNDRAKKNYNSVAKSLSTNKTERKEMAFKLRS